MLLRLLLLVRVEQLQQITLQYFTKIKLMRTNGITEDNKKNINKNKWYYEQKTLGYNFRTTNKFRLL